MFTSQDLLPRNGAENVQTRGREGGTKKAQSQAPGISDRGSHSKLVLEARRVWEGLMASPIDGASRRQKEI